MHKNCFILYDCLTSVIFVENLKFYQKTKFFFYLTKILQDFFEINKKFKLFILF